MKKPLVSIITPCYNAEKYIVRLLDSILLQSHSSIEFIAINDGSTDKTLSILQGYKDRFAEKNIDFRVVSKKNGGVASAVNRGLKEFNGEYITFIDADDYLNGKNSLQKRVEFLEKNKTVDIVYCAANVVDAGDNDLAKVRDVHIFPPFHDNLFLNILLEQNYFWPPCGQLVRAKSLLKVNPDREILISQAGQNIQLSLPLLYKGKVGYINEPLVTIVDHDDSHSRQQRSVKDMIIRQKQLQETYIDTLSKIDMPKPERECYVRLINNKYDAVLLRIENDNLRTQIDTLHGSRSWRVTKPLRSISELKKFSKSSR
ncbi:glycosyltransferase [Candidatus Saccharibacteria bacterium]|nr:glycosyltransferase [Candidatus Saccharibacteria bacterium]